MKSLKQSFVVVSVLVVMFLLPVASYATCQGCPLNEAAGKEHQIILLESIRRDLSELTKYSANTSAIKLATHVLETAKKIKFSGDCEVLWKDFVTNMNNVKFSLVQLDLTDANLYFKDAQMLFRPIYKAVTGKELAL